MRRVFAAVAAGLVLSACSTSPDEPAPEETPEAAEPSEDAAEEATPAAECEEVPAAGLASIAEGLKGGGEYTAGQAVAVEAPEFAMNFAVAVDGPGGVALFGMGEPAEGGGPIIAANDVAQETTVWGEATTSGSPVAEARDVLASSPEAAAALDCL